MKIATPKEMQELESKAYADGFAESDFMEQAGLGIAKIVLDYIRSHKLDSHVILLCGKGNNAGDAYVTGHHLLKMGCKVQALQMVPMEQCSVLCQLNHDLFLAQGGKVLLGEAIHSFVYPESGIIVDGIFGTGFKGKVEEPFASVIQQANASSLPIIAIDIPSGLDGETGASEEKKVIHAVETAYLTLPKQGFFLNNGWNYVGKLRYVSIGLPETYLANFTSRLELLSDDRVKHLLPPLVRNRHKYQTGYVVGVAGSPEMPGAALLASIASLKGGAGIMRLLYPDGMQQALSGAPFELIKAPFQYHDVEAIVKVLDRATASFIGPGIGQTEEAARLVNQLLKHLKKPCVIDADALNILAKNDVPLLKNCILTPHTGEMSRLLDLSYEHLDPDYLEHCQAYAERHQATVVLKGAPGFIFHPGKPILINSRGDPGMATAGSGDVLTGFLAALLAQGLTAYQAAALGVFLHGIAGEFAAEECTSYCMTAMDILAHFPQAFKLLV